MRYGFCEKTENRNPFSNRAGVPGIVWKKQPGLAIKANHYQWKKKLQVECKVVKRKPGNVAPLSPAENNLFCNLTRESFDKVQDTLCFGSMAEPEQLVHNALRSPKTVQELGFFQPTKRLG